MGVADEHFRFDGVHPAQVVDDLLEDLQTAQRTEVALVRRQDDAIVDRQRDGVLEVGADGQQRAGHRAAQLEFQRGVAASQADRAQRAADGAEHRVVGRPADRAVVMQERIGHVAKPLLDAGRVGEDRLAADICRGGDERAAEFLYEQVVQR